MREEKARERILAGHEARTIEERRAFVAINAERRAAARQVARDHTHAARVAASHSAHVQAYRDLSDTENYRHHYRNNPAFVIKERLRRQLRKKAEAVPGLAELIRRAIKVDRTSNIVESALGYSIAQLKTHLERQFSKGMNWDTWSKGGIHIDHILPRKCFDLTTMDGVQAYWSLSNLRPLWATRNLQKSDKIETLL